MSISNNTAATNAVIDVSIGGGNTVDASGALYLGNVLNATFIGPGTLIINEQQPVDAGLTLDGFQNHDTTEVSGFSGWSTYSVNVSTPAGGTTTDTITFAGVPYSLTFTHVPVGDTITASQSGGNTDIVATACFLSGTAIATPDGARPVESLAAGDLVLTRAGVARRVVWAGYRRVRAGARRPACTWPVRITADAIAPGVPLRDLLVTPEHAVLVDGHLLPARLLVNGATIRSEALDRYSFHHIELETHDLLLAEGMAAESYLDTGNRALFAGGTVVGLHAHAEAPDAASYRARGCMQLTLDPAVTGAIWRRLAARAAALGHPVRLAPRCDAP
ncbi:Hint domain-containing protein, partial [Acidisphaera rubrifaciens]|uniref:Hint domain-containing protein n=1 Tax=Acidisphaera rubrifaciens TaxID=50715 RepID=UPI0006623383